MAAIWDLDNLADLEAGIREAFDEALQISVDELDNVDPQDIQIITLEEVWVVGPWANDTAEFGEDEIRLEVGMDAEGIDDPSEVVFFMELTQWVVGIMESIIDNLPQQFGLEEFVGVGGEEGLSIERFPMDQKTEQLSRSLGRAEGNRAVNLTDFTARPFREGVLFENLPIETIQELREQREPEEESEEEEVEEEPEEPEEVEEEPLTPEELLAEEFPDVPALLRPYAVDEDPGVILEIPSGVRWEKKIRPRDMYPFEVIQATNRPSPIDLPFSAPVEMQDEVAPGIGEAISAGFFDREGPARANQIPPSTYPRTGVYIKNYLRHQGPAYALMMYNDFLIYLGYVNQIHRTAEGEPFSLNIGTYRSFREYIYMLRQVSERMDQPELIISLSQQQAAARGLETIPDHPTIEDEKAPWLARRQWYDINIDAFEHPAWEDPYSYIHGDEEDEGR